MPTEDFEFNDTHYIGIRIRKDDPASQLPDMIEFNDTLKIFYAKLQEWVDQEEKHSKVVKEKLVDVKINYRRREYLPDLVRPADL